MQVLAITVCISFSCINPSTVALWMHLFISLIDAYPNWQYLNEFEDVDERVPFHEETLPLVVRLEKLKPLDTVTWLAKSCRMIAMSVVWHSQFLLQSLTNNKCFKGFSKFWHRNKLVWIIVVAPVLLLIFLGQNLQWKKREYKKIKLIDKTSKCGGAYFLQKICHIFSFWTPESHSSKKVNSIFTRALVYNLTFGYKNDIIE